jgi:hypothetical protein
MAQILKLTKKVRKIGKGSGRIVVQDIKLKEYAGKNVVIRIATN